MSEYRKALSLLVKHGSFGADPIAIRMRHDGVSTGADITKAVIEKALETLVGNGLVEIVPMDKWPDYVIVDPPYNELLP